MAASASAMCRAVSVAMMAPVAPDATKVTTVPLTVTVSPGLGFDTSVIDLTSDCEDPVETLMKVQLGGGTDIGQAMTYAASLVENPRRTIIVLITDFFEGGPIHNLLRVTQKLKESGVHLLGLAALDDKAEPAYDRETAKRLVDLGMHVGAMTPGELANWVAEKIG